MSEPNPTTDIPDNIGRNDPCPCGSGRKYKKCCRRRHRLQKEAEKKSQAPHRIVGPDTIPWGVFKRLRQIQDNNAVGVFYDLCHDQGPFRERFSDKSAFVTAIDNGEISLPAAGAFKLVHMRLDPPDTYLVIREDDPKQSDVAFQLVTLRRNEIDADGGERDVEHAGFRIWDYQPHRIDRDQLGDELSMDIFNIQWRPVDQ